MKNNFLSKKLGETILFVVLVLIILTPFVYIFFNCLHKSFWDNAMSNMLATVLALVAGIPIALWIDRFARSTQEKEKFVSDRKREKDILFLIKEELDFSLNTLFFNGKKGNSLTLTIDPLKSDLWNSLVSGGETKYIEDPTLLNRITSAYYVLNIVKDIEHQSYVALRSATVTFNNRSGTPTTAAQLLLQDARIFDKLFEDSLVEALKMIDKRIKKLNKDAKK